MKLTLTSAAANKRIKALEDEKLSIRNQESDVQFYTSGINETVEVPYYNFKETTEKIDAIDKEIAALRHAINLFNVTTVLPDEGITVDMALVRIAQLNRKAEELRKIKDRPEKVRYEGRLGGVPTITYRNYDAEEVRNEYRKVTDEIYRLQMAIDTVNLSKQFDVEI